MPSELQVEAEHLGLMRIEARAGGHRVRMDYPTQEGQDLQGFTPLQLLLASLAGCAGNTLALLLRRARQPLEGLSVRVHARRRDEHPTVITSVEMDFVCRGAGLDEAAVRRALEEAEKSVCPVWAMLKPAVAVTARFSIEAA